MTDSELIMQAMDDEIESLREEVRQWQAVAESYESTAMRQSSENAKLRRLVQAYDMCVGRTTCVGCALYVRSAKSSCLHVEMADAIGVEVHS